MAYLTNEQQATARVGKLTRPAPDAEPTMTTLTATIRRGEDFDTKTFEVTVLPWTHSEIVNYEAQALTMTSLLNGNTSENNIIGNLLLKTTGFHGVQIAWASTISTIISTDGKVTRPTYSIGDQKVTLTATLTSGEAEARKISFEFTVKKAAATSEELVEEYVSKMDAKTFVTGDDVGIDPTTVGITKNLNLPATAPGNATSNITITWVSDQPDVISNNGAITPQSIPVIVKLTATVAHGIYTSTRLFNIRVAALVGVDE